MLFVIHCLDKPNQGELRAATRPAHLAYIAGFADKVVQGGPTLSDDGETMTGSLIVVDLESPEAAAEFSRNDPYTQAGLFESVTIQRWKNVIPAR